MQIKNNFSRVIAGTMTWGSWGKQLSKEGMITLMQHCIESGITTFDHADIYGDYGNEAEFGKAFAGSGISRETIQLISKCGIQHTKGRENRIKHYNYSKDYIIWSAEQSLRNLQTDYLDLFLLHRPSPLMHPLEIAEALLKLKEDGKVMQVGVSNFTPSQIRMVEKGIRIEANQVEFSLLHDIPMYDGTFDDCIENNRIAQAWSPLGSYFSSEENQQTKRLSMALDQLTAKYNCSDSQLLLAWIFKHPAIVHPVVGTTNKERLTESVKAEAIDIELEDWFVLLEASQGHKVP